MKEYKKYVIGGVFTCLMAVTLMVPIEKSEAFWPFSKAKTENNINYTGAVANTESNKIKPVPSITVVSPNGGETLQGGKVYTIKWKSSGLNKKAPIQIKLDTMTSSTTSEETNIVTSTPNTGVYKWKVPVNVSGVNIFKIIVATGYIGGTDMSDGFFTIVQKIGKPSIHIFGLSGNQRSDTLITVQQGDEVIISGVPLNMRDSYTRSFFFDEIFNGNCSNNESIEKEWIMNCNANNIGQSRFYVEIYGNGQTYRSNVVVVEVKPKI